MELISREGLRKRGAPCIGYPRQSSPERGNQGRDKVRPNSQPPTTNQVDQAWRDFKAQKGRTPGQRPKRVKSDERRQPSQIRGSRKEDQADWEGEGDQAELDAINWERISGPLKRGHSSKRRMSQERAPSRPRSRSVSVSPIAKFQRLWHPKSRTNPICRDELRDLLLRMYEKYAPPPKNGLWGPVFLTTRATRSGHTSRQEAGNRTTYQSGAKER